MSMNRRVSNHKPEELSDEDDLSNVNVKSLVSTAAAYLSSSRNKKLNLKKKNTHTLNPPAYQKFSDKKLPLYRQFFIFISFFFPLLN